MRRSAETPLHTARTTAWSLALWLRKTSRVKVSAFMAIAETIRDSPAAGQAGCRVWIAPVRRQGRAALGRRMCRSFGLQQSGNGLGGRAAIRAGLGEEVAGSSGVRAPGGDQRWQKCVVERTRLWQA